LTLSLGIEFARILRARFDVIPVAEVLLFVQSLCLVGGVCDSVAFVIVIASHPQQARLAVVVGTHQRVIACWLDWRSFVLYFSGAHDFAGRIEARLVDEIEFLLMIIVSYLQRV
jgi:hypothetical protein